MAKKQNISIKSETTNIAATPIRANISTISETLTRTESTLSVPQRENFVKPLDPQRLAWQAKYKTQGLTVTSNNQNIIPRDGAGNIVLKEDEQNPLLIIESVATKITTDSILKVIDTRFNYYKFPVTVIETVVDDIDLEFDNIEVELLLPTPTDSRNQIADWQGINTSYPSTWYYNDGATVASGFREMPFAGGLQPRVNAYTLTKSTIETLKSKNKTLKFTIQLQFSPSVGGDTIFRVRLERGNPKSWRPWLFPMPEIVTTSREIDYPVTYFEFFVNSNDMVEGDNYFVKAVSGNPSWSLNANAFWKVEVVDIPKTKPLFGITNTSGIYYIAGNSMPTTLNSIDSNGIETEIGSKFPGRDTFITAGTAEYDSLMEVYFN